MAGAYDERLDRRPGQHRLVPAQVRAGEGLNLQRAHLMVNCDLPWNPNRIEQRFGRIHRIGQTEVCHLWNLVAEGTREGMVFARLLDKIEQQRLTYQGQGLRRARAGRATAEARYLDYEPIEDSESKATRHLAAQPWLSAGVDQLAVDWAVERAMPALLARTRQQVSSPRDCSTSCSAGRPPHPRAPRKTPP